MKKKFSKTLVRFVDAGGREGAKSKVGPPVLEKSVPIAEAETRFRELQAKHSDIEIRCVNESHTRAEAKPFQFSKPPGSAVYGRSQPV